MRCFAMIRFFAVMGMCLIVSFSAPEGLRAQVADNDETIQDCQDCPELVVIGPGEFERLNHPNPWIRGERANRGDSHTVTLGRPYAIGRYEVTRSQYEACVEVGPCTETASEGEQSDPTHPVVNVNWHEAQTYVEWLSLETGQTYRLPTEAEWEYAARGGQNGKFFTSDSAGPLCEQANMAGPESDLDWANNLCRDAFPGTAPPGSFDSNAYGLYDVAGNVWEWVEDCYHDSDWEASDEWSNEYQTQTPHDGTAFIGTHAQCHSRIMRGGSWRNGGVHVFSPHFRNFDYAIRRYSNLGFRVVRRVDHARDITVKD